LAESQKYQECQSQLAVHSKRRTDKTQKALSDIR